MQIPAEFPGLSQANAFLHAMNPNTQARGEKCFREGCVLDVEMEDPNFFIAYVRDSKDYKVSLEFSPPDGWFCDCSCPIGYNCKHIYAAMKALLAENSAAKVQQLTVIPPLAAPTKKKIVRSAPTMTLAQELLQLKGGPFNADEKRFLAKLQLTHARCVQYRKITRWDFDELGLSLGGYGWDALHIWPSFPATEREFWLYVANAAIEHGVKLPEFMLPVSDVNEVQDSLRRWRRNCEIDRWKKTMDHAQRWPSSVTAASDGMCELRGRFGEKAVALEWRRPGREAFEPLKSTQARQFREDVKKGSVELSAESHWLWETFSARLDFSPHTDVSYTDAVALEKLGRMFRMPAFDALLVNPDGNPFARPKEVLRWNLVGAESEQDDYRLGVTQSDGSPIPQLLCVLEGRPALFVTRDAVFLGPPVEGGVLAPNRENVIPAPALETRAGAALLHSIGVEFPPRLRERIRTVPLHVVITCVLKEMYPGSTTENCTVAVQAHTAEGDSIETWNGSWSSISSLPGAKEKPGSSITIYDRSAMRDPRSLLLGLDARWEAYQGVWSLRVTKKFPDIFANWLKSVPPDVKVELKGDLASFMAETVAGSVRLDVTETEMDWFDLRVVLDVADTTLTPEELKLLLNARGKYVRLGDKGWRRLQFNLTGEEDEKLARLGLNPRELTAEPQRLHALQLADKSAKKFLSEEQFERIERRAGEIKTRVTPDLPATVTATLRPYQLEGFHFLAYLAENRFGGILADDMGLGKTLQTLTWLQWLRNREQNPESKTENIPSLVVCPKSVMDNWRAEVERFTPGLRVKSWSAGELDQLLGRLDEADLHVLNYSQLRLIGESLAPVRWLTVILDEGQYIKNPNSQTAQVARALRAQHRLVLSGTPIENRLMDLWSLMAFAMPGALGSRAQFAKLYDAKEDPFARRRLSARVRPFLLRRTKGQVAKDLPDRTEEDLFCEIEGEQRTLYRAELKRAQQMLLRITTQKQLAKERFHFLTSLLRLRQICCHPKLVKPESKAPSAKVESLLEQLEPLMEEGHKVLVFSQFVEMLDILQGEITPKGWPSFYLSGATENRGELVQHFQNAKGAAVFLISLKAGGFGLNLTAASYVVLFDPWWNPAVENQAIDRTHRIGQTRNVMAYRLLIKNSIEEKIRLLQKTKSSLAEDVLGEEKFAQSLTLDDMQFLLSDSG